MRFDGFQFLTCMFNAVGVAVVYNGAGRHIQNVSPAELEIWFKLYYSCACSYLIIACVVKGSLLALLWRLFPVREYYILASFRLCLSSE